jgi:hypothetical protein
LIHSRLRLQPRGQALCAPSPVDAQESSNFLRLKSNLILLFPEIGMLLHSLFLLLPHLVPSLLPLELILPRLPISAGTLTFF